MPSTDATGPEYATGTESFSRIARGEVTEEGDERHARGNEVDTIETMNDPRVTGTGTVSGSADLYGAVRPQWGTYRLENAGGAWEGTWTGMLWNAGDMTDVVGWLVGSGDYKGYTYYFHARGTGTLDIESMIFLGSPPSP